MRITEIFTSVRVQLPGPRIALMCLMLGAVALGASFWSDSPPQSWPVVGMTGGQWLPAMGAGLGLLALLASAFCLVGAASSGRVSPAADPSEGLLTGLRAVVEELTGLLAEERSQTAALRQSCAAATQDAVAATAHVAKMAETAIDAETRLAAGVTQADKALRQPAAVVTWAAEATQRVERALPEIAELIRNGPGAAAPAAFDAAAAERLASAVEDATRIFQATIVDATGQLNALGELSGTLRRDAIALDTAGREIATAGATVVARVAESVGQVGAALASLPDAVATVTTAAENINRSLEDISTGMRADSAALLGIESVAVAAAESLREAGRALVVDQRVNEIAAEGVQAAADRIAAIGEGVEAVRVNSAGLAELTERLRDAAGVLMDGTGSLDAAGLRIARGLDQAGAGIAAAGDTMVARLADALLPLPGAVASVTAAAAQAADAVTDASAVLRAEAAALEACGLETMQAAEAVLQENEALRTAGQVSAEAERQVIAVASHGLEVAAGRLTGLIAEADGAEARIAGLASIAETLEHVTLALAEGAGAMEAAGQRAWAVHETAAERSAVSAERGEAAWRELPDAVAKIAAASAGLQVQTQALASAARRVTATGFTSTAALTDIEVRLTGVVDRTQRQTAEQLEALRGQLEQVIALQPAEQEASMAGFKAVSGEIVESARRIESALAEHDSALAALVAAITQAPPADGAGDRVDAGDADRALAATLGHLDSVTAQTELLLRQTEALAEAVLDGRAPELSSLLSDRAPMLLAGVENTTRRLRSVATALALASDGPVSGKRRLN